MKRILRISHQDNRKCSICQFIGPSELPCDKFCQTTHPPKAVQYLLSKPLSKSIGQIMTHATDIGTLVRWMAGDFCNQAQAFENPPFFAHIRVCMRPLPNGFLSGASLFLEQAYDCVLTEPYRLRILEFLPMEDKILLHNHSIKDGERFHGAARNPELLQKIQPEDVVEMPGCSMWVDWTGKSFIGRIQPGKGCKVNWRGQDTYLDNEFEISADQLTSLDRGRDLVTDERVWGSIAGPFHFTRRTSFAHEVNL